MRIGPPALASRCNAGDALPTLCFRLPTNQAHHELPIPCTVPCSAGCSFLLTVLLLPSIFAISDQAVPSSSTSLSIVASSSGLRGLWFTSGLSWLYHLRSRGRKQAGS